MAQRSELLQKRLVHGRDRKCAVKEQHMGERKCPGEPCQVRRDPDT